MHPRCQQIREIIRDFKRDWIPSHAGDTHVIQSVKNIRPAEGLERCCACVGVDVQSGPMYCGDLADIVADVVNMPGCIVAVCKRHARRMDDFPVET